MPRPTLPALSARETEILDTARCVGELRAMLAKGAA